MKTELVVCSKLVVIQILSNSCIATIIFFLYIFSTRMSCTLQVQSSFLDVRKVY